MPDTGFSLISHIAAVLFCPRVMPYLSHRYLALECVLRATGDRFLKCLTLGTSAVQAGVNTLRELQSSWLSKFNDLILKDDQHGIGPFEN